MRIIALVVVVLIWMIIESIPRGTVEKKSVSGFDSNPPQVAIHDEVRVPPRVKEPVVKETAGRPPESSPPPEKAAPFDLAPFHPKEPVKQKEKGPVVQP